MIANAMNYKLFADYFQFYIQDDSSDIKMPEQWDESAMSHAINISDGIIVVGTVRNTFVPVEIEIIDKKPNYIYDEWDKINECNICIKAGSLVIAGCTDYFETASRLKLEPGQYGVLVFYKNLAKLSEDHLNGDDLYKLILWPSKEINALKYIK
jgi:hypothetical protein